MGEGVASREAPVMENLFTWKGEVGRGPYAGWGFGLAALKYNLDRLVAVHLFDRPWTLESYLETNPESLLLNSAEAIFYGTILTLALPFVWIGVSMTIRRLRSIGAPTWLAVLFFAPAINLLFFLILSLIPARGEQYEPDNERRGFAWLLPRNPLGAAVVGTVLAGLFGVGCALVAVHGLEVYGWGLFVGIPFVAGLLAALVVNARRPRPITVSLMAAVLTQVVIGVVLLVIAAEGVLCLLMAAPIAIGVSLLGGVVGHHLAHLNADSGSVVAALMLSLPLMMGAEARLGLQPRVAPVCTEIIIDAPPEAVWEYVVSFADLPPPRHPLLKTGVAYPIRARIQGSGVGAIRYCEFSTGAFVEPITVWDQPHRLAFDVIRQPRAMDEWSPYSDIDAPHLDNALESKRGEFLLEPLPGGGTRLVGTTWYQNRMWPEPYWRFWSDLLIHSIHTEVLHHVKNSAEGKK